MAISKEKFISEGVAELSRSPAMAARYQAGDPMVVQPLAAMAAMLARMSEFVSVASMEQFTMARDSTVLADSAAKGIIRYGTPTEALARVTNPAPSALTIATGRQLLDQQGRRWVVMRGAVIPASGEGLVYVQQISRRTIEHTIAQHKAFYAIEVPAPAIGYLASVSVDGYSYQPSFSNTKPGDAVYSLKLNEQQTLCVQFGLADVAGMQLDAGAGVVLRVTDTEGAIDDVLGSALEFEYLNGASEAGVKLVIESVEVQGRNPMDVATLREMSRYPSLYDEDAVYLGDFDALVRRKLGPFDFLSVWNEQKQEEAVGPSLDWVSGMFVAARKIGTSDETLRAKIAQTILAADDGYVIHHIDVVDAPVTVDITAYVNPVYDTEQVRQDIVRVMLENYGPESEWATRGNNKLLQLPVFNRLRQNIEALQDEQANLQMEVTESVERLMPWHFRRLTAETLSVTVRETDQ